MTISKYNSEGYLDLTAHDAMEAIEQQKRDLRARRPIVFICSPYAGDIPANTEAARRYSRFAVNAGRLPIAPHLLFPQFMDDADPVERELELVFGNAMMSKCSEVWVFGDLVTNEMEWEVWRAYMRSKTIRWFTEDMKEIDKPLPAACKTLSGPVKRKKKPKTEGVKAS